MDRTVQAGARGAAALQTPFIVKPGADGEFDLGLLERAHHAAHTHVGAGLEVEQAKHMRGQPSGADLFARNPRPVGNDDVPAGASQETRARGARGSATDDQRVTADHTRSVAASYGSSRVHEGGRDSAGVKTIWNSCIVAVSSPSG